jgi:hypothetical protein
LYINVAETKDLPIDWGEMVNSFSLTVIILSEIINMEMLLSPVSKCRNISAEAMEPANPKRTMVIRIILFKLKFAEFENKILYAVTNMAMLSDDRIK